MTYREHVHRALSVHHANLEMYLTKAREQETFVSVITTRLNRHNIRFKFHLNDDLDAIFTVSRQYSGSLNQVFEYANVSPTDTGFLLFSRDGMAEVEFIYESDI